MRNLLQDLRYSWRTLLRAPGFTLVAVLTLALGIGANTAIFSVVHATIFKPLPFRDPGKLVAVWDTYFPNFPKLGVSPLEYATLEQQTDLFAQTAWYRYVPQDLNLTAPGAEPLEVHTTFVSQSLLPMLGVSPALGRAFTDSDGPNAALLSHALWMRRFAGDPSVVGRSIRLGEREFTVTGVMPAEFQFPEWAEVWLPKGPQLGDETTNPVRHSLGFVARLRPEANLGQVSTRTATLIARLAAEHPKTSTGFGMKVADLHDDLTAGSRPTLLLLLGAVAMVLLVACGNIANLLLARASGRTREMAVRTALGAGAWRLVRQLLTESVVLAGAGGAVGLVLASWSLAAIAPLRAPLDASVMLFLLAVSTATGLVSGLVPALQTLRTDTNAVIKTSSPAGGGASVARGVLVVLEFAAALMLVVGASILVKSFLRMMYVDPGFEARGVLTLRLSVPPSRDAKALLHRIEEGMRRLPGVDLVASSNTLPLIADRANTTRFHVPGSPLINPQMLPAAQIRAVSPDYFTAMHVPLRSGRAFTERDLGSDAVIINETMARRYWPGRDPVGLKFVTGPWGPNPNFSTIVGVAGDVKNFGLDADPGMDLYFPAYPLKYLVVHTAASPAGLSEAARRAVLAADADLPVTDIRTMEEILDKSSSTRRWTMTLLAAFAGLALLLALVGIYGVMSWTVSQRTREIGIRMALGAGRGQVLGMVLRYGLKLSSIGLALGVGGALALRRVLAGLVFDVSPADPAIYLGVALLMLFVALLACYVPARRASRVDPLLALRWE